MRQSINIKSKFTPTFACTYFSTTSSIHIFSFYEFSWFGELHCSSANLDDPRVPCEYLLAVTSGRITVVGTKVLELDQST